jgi:hypothetical protein
VMHVAECALPCSIGSKSSTRFELCTCSCEGLSIYSEGQLFLLQRHVLVWRGLKVSRIETLNCGITLHFRKQRRTSWELSSENCTSVPN